MTETFGERVKLLRRERGWVQQQLADKMHVTRYVVSNWESHFILPNMAYVVRLAVLFDVSNDFLLTGREAPRHVALHNAIRERAPRAVLLAMVNRNG